MHNILEMLLSKRFCVVLLNECFLLLVWAKHKFLQLFLNWLFFIVAQGKVGGIHLCVEAIFFCLKQWSSPQQSPHNPGIHLCRSVSAIYNYTQHVNYFFTLTLIPVIIALFIMPRCLQGDVVSSSLPCCICNWKYDLPSTPTRESLTTPCISGGGDGRHISACQTSIRRDQKKSS